MTPLALILKQLNDPKTPRAKIESLLTLALGHLRDPDCKIISDEEWNLCTLPEFRKVCLLYGIKAILNSNQELINLIEDLTK